MATNFQEAELRERVKQGTLPQHVAIIMDGNGRWAKKRRKPRVWGHRQGVKSVRCVVETAGELGIKVLTLYAFSEENWGRPAPEVAALMSLLGTYVVKEKKALNENNVQFRTIGCLEKLPAETRRLVRETEEFLRPNTGLILNVALSYSAKSELANACKQIAEKVARGELDAEQVGPETIEDHLWTRALPEPDLLIRTSGEQRLSNFLLWQLAYTELWFTPVHWPDFREMDFYEAILAYQSRCRRFGQVGEADSVGGGLRAERPPQQQILGY